jgi:hypothetical protein
MKFPVAITLMIFSFLQADAQTKIAIKAGFNYSTAKATFSGEKQATGYVPGANFAIQLKTAFDGPLHFSPYIGYSSRGFIIKSGNSTGDQTRNFINYIDVAPVLSLDFATSKTSSFAVSFGPLASLAISGTEKTRVAFVTNSSKMHFSTSENYGLFDLALHTGISYHFNKMFAELAYQYGFASINNNEEHDKKNIRNRTFSINVGYYFRSYK